MKKLIISTITFVAFLSILYAGFNVVILSGDESTNMQEVTFKVDGMTCRMCPLTIKTALSKLDGVLNTEVSYEDNEAKIEYEDDRVTESDMVNAIENAGNYNVTKINKD